MDEPPSLLSRELVCCRFPLLDGAGNAPWLLHAAIDTAATLLRSRTPTLIACSAGMSRSPCIAAAAISRATGRAPDDCLRDVIRDAPADISPGLWSSVQAALARFPTV